MSAKVDGSTSKDVLKGYTMDHLETIYFKKQLTDDEAAARIKDPRGKTSLTLTL